ncbi:MAG TPA: PTS transporter subunit IIC [Anaeromyxobacter sp.]|nr:PTS transporter subunit IIC [Anaeromyxobacter sp.]
MEFLNSVDSAVHWILNLGPSVMLPIILTIFGVILGQKFAKSFRAGLTIGVGFVGINLLIGLFFGSLGPAAQAMAQATGAHLEIVDVGWPIGAAIAFGTPLAPVMIPIILVFNFILIVIGLTKTMDVDIWNYWHLIFAASIAYYAFNSVTIAIIVGLVHAFIVFKLADWTAPTLEHHFGLKGISLPHAETVNFAPVMYFLDKIWSKIPGLSKVNADAEAIQKRFGLLGEPLVMGLVLGIVIGALGGQGVAKTITLGVQMAAVLVLLPRMVSILMEGLIPLSEGAREFLAKRFPGKDLFIGLDAAIVIGHPSGMAVALVMVPITLILAIILPYNRMMPFADFAVLPFTMVWAVAASRGNIVRGIINGVFTMLIVFFIATELAPLMTTMGKAVGFNFPAGATEISGIDVGSHLLLWMIIKIIDFKNNAGWAVVGLVVAVLYGLIWYWVRNDIRTQYKEQIAEAEAEAAAAAQAQAQAANQ